jgi:MtN3 and saliva related transmembrane protein
MAISPEQVVGLSAGILTSVSSLPQLIKIAKEKEAKDVSLKMLFILLAGVALWIVYGIFKKDIPVIATNSLSFLLNCTLLILRIIYGTK